MAKFGWSTFNEDYFGRDRLDKTYRKQSIHGIPLGIDVRGTVRRCQGNTSQAVVFRVRRGNGVAGSISGHRYQDKMKYYTPTNPQTVPQQANRTKFSNGITAWQALSDSQKNVYRARAIRLRFATGFTLYMSEYMLS